MKKLIITLLALPVMACAAAAFQMDTAALLAADVESALAAIDECKPAKEKFAERVVTYKKKAGEDIDAAIKYAESAEAQCPGFVRETGLLFSTVKDERLKEKLTSQHLIKLFWIGPKFHSGKELADIAKLSGKNDDWAEFTAEIFGSANCNSNCKKGAYIAAVSNTEPQKRRLFMTARALITAAAENKDESTLKKQFEETFSVANIEFVKLHGDNLAALFDFLLTKYPAGAKDTVEVVITAVSTQAAATQNSKDKANTISDKPSKIFAWHAVKLGEDEDPEYHELAGKYIEFSQKATKLAKK